MWCAGPDGLRASEKISMIIQPDAAAGLWPHAREWESQNRREVAGCAQSGHRSATGCLVCLTLYRPISPRSFNPESCQHKIQAMRRPLLQKLCWNCCRENGRVAARVLGGSGMDLFTALHTIGAAELAVGIVQSSTSSRVLALATTVHRSGLSPVSGLGHRSRLHEHLHASARFLPHAWC